MGFTVMLDLDLHLSIPVGLLVRSGRGNHQRLLDVLEEFSFGFLLY